MKGQSEEEKLVEATKRLERAVEETCLGILAAAGYQREALRRREQLAAWQVWVGTATQVQHGLAPDPQTSLAHVSLDVSHISHQESSVTELPALPSLKGSLS